MGIRGSSYAGENPDHRAAMERIGAACASHGVVAGIMCGSPGVAQQWRGLGFRMLAIESDARLLARGAENDAKQCRELETAAAR
jgi:2-keto-3-deoxy-L-rhamnonate aldolase RhmA